MSQFADTQPSSLEEILQILRNQAIAIPTPSTSSRYLRALDSLQASALHLSPSADSPSSVSGDNRAAGLSQGDIENNNSQFSILNSQLILTNWLVNQWLMNTPFTTASLYLDIISSLYGSAAKAGLLPPTKIFSQIKASLKELGPDGWKSGIDDEIFTRALRLTKNASHLIADDATAAQMVIWSLTHSLQPLSQIALLKNSSRYWLPLRQSQRTPKQLQTHVNNIVNALFKRARLPQATDPYQTVEALWAYAALRAGIPAGDLVAHLGHAPLGLPILKLSVVSCQLSELIDRVAGLSQGETSSFKEIGRVFLDNPPRWYAMSLRPRVRFTQVCRRIQLLSTSNAQRTTHDAPPELFYPCEEIARAIGKKIVTRQRPFIHSVVFFRAKLTDIGRLFSKIGDLAWCYRQSARLGAPYAEISERQFLLFQQTIARFTHDYEVASTGGLELKKNDRVRILGGLFGGHEAIMEGRLSSLPTESNTASGVVYRLNIIGDNGIEWRIHVDPRLAKPIDH